MCMCRLAIASNLGSIYNVFSSRKGGAEVFSVAVMNYLFGTENSGKRERFFSKEHFSSCVFKQELVVVLLVVIKLVREIKGALASSYC